MKPVAIVLGTYNRKALLLRAIASIRAAVGAHPYCIVVSDGGSTDGTRQYLLGCRDVVMLDGGLDGAVMAFNAGFGWAVEQNFPYVMHLNDDAEIMPAKTGYPIALAIDILEGDPTIGEVAFEFDLRGAYGFEKVNGAPYANFGVVRREAGMAVAQVQGDPEGRQWWNPIYRTYGADCEFGCNLWRLGWHVYPARGLRVHDCNQQDALRAGNEGNNKNGDADLFWSRWRSVDLLRYVPPRLASYAANSVESPIARRGRQPKENPEYQK